MKGAIHACGILFLACSVFAAVIHLQTEEMMLDTMNQAVKRSIIYTMEAAVKLDVQARNTDWTTDTFSAFFKVLAPENYHYSIMLLGFSPHPLLMRIKVSAQDELGRTYEFEETMIEEVKANEK